MGYRHFIVVVFCLCSGIPASAQYEQLLHKSYGERFRYMADWYYVTLRFADSTTIFRKLGTLKQLATKQKDEDLLLETRLLEANYYFNNNYPPNILLPMLRELETEAVKREKLWLQASVKNMTALYDFGRQWYELGFEHHQKLYELIKDVPPKDFPPKQDCLNEIADKYYQFRDFRESISYTLEALKADPPYPIHPYPMRLNILNTLGLSYQQLNLLDSSDLYFREATALAKKTHSRAWEGIASGNLGQNFFLKNEYDKAVPLLEKDVQIAVEYADWGLASGSLMVLAQIDFQQNNISAAEKHLNLAKQYAYASRQYHRLKELYPLLSKLYSIKNQPHLSMKYLDSAIVVRDSLDRKFSSLLLVRAKQKAELREYKAEMNLAEGRRKLYLFQRNVLISAVILMMGAAVYFYIAYTRRSRLKQEQLRKAEEELALASKQLTDFARNISEKNALIEMLENQSSRENGEILEKLQRSTILTDDEWDYFRNLFEKVHAGFFTRLKEKLPGLSPAETKFIALSKLDFSNNEIMAILGVGPNAIRQYRLRLRKKLNLGEDFNLRELISDI